MKYSNLGIPAHQLYRRIMLEERKKLQHQSKVNYEQQFGDSDDIYMEDVDTLEQEFTAPLQSGSLSQGVDAPLEDEEIAAQMYEAYVAELQSQGQSQDAGHSSSLTKAHHSDEFEDEFDDIDPQILASIVGSR
ncbi:hypothetical protein FRC17_004608 [Serendipita sp. 399]|nr:hypothetical protein FRC17_004608 [Serendipita sp. 399]